MDADIPIEPYSTPVPRVAPLEVSLALQLANSMPARRDFFSMRSAPNTQAVYRGMKGANYGIVLSRLLTSVRGSKYPGEKGS